MSCDHFLYIPGNIIYFCVCLSVVVICYRHSMLLFVMFICVIEEIFFLKKIFLIIDNL